MEDKTIKKNRDLIIQQLLKTKRPGVSDLLDYMDDCGFYEAPCSSQYHLCEKGGLAQHSIYVLAAAIRVRHALAPEVPEESIIICSLLHDLGKCGQFGKPGYVPNMLKPRATKANPDPEPVQSDKKPYISNPDLMQVDHEIRSVQIIGQHMILTEDENWAILMHNGLYGSFRYQIPGKETALYLILHFADMWASRIVEKEVKTDE